MSKKKDELKKYDEENLPALPSEFEKFIDTSVDEILEEFSIMDIAHAVASAIKKSFRKPHMTKNDLVKESIRTLFQRKMIKLKNSKTQIQITDGTEPNSSGEQEPTGPAH